MVVTLDHFWFIPLVVILMYFTLDVTLHLWFSRHLFLLGRDPYVLILDVTLHLCVPLVVTLIPLVVTLMLFNLDMTLHLWSSRRDPLSFFFGRDLQTFLAYPFSRDP